MINPYKIKGKGSVSAKPIIAIDILNGFANCPLLERVV